MYLRSAVNLPKILSDKGNVYRQSLYELRFLFSRVEGILLILCRSFLCHNAVSFRNHLARLKFQEKQRPGIFSLPKLSIWGMASLSHK